MALPKQNIPESKKGKQWAEDCVKAIVMMSKSQSQQILKDRICYNMYAGVQNEKDFEYLTKAGKHQYPAKIRFIPILRTKIDRLVSEESSRPFKYRVFTIDMNSVKTKQDEKYRQIVDEVYQRYIDTQDEILELMNQMDMMAQQAQEEAQKQGQAAQESGAPPDAKTQMKLAETLGKIERLKKRMNPKSIIAEEDIQKIEEKFKYNYRTALEEKVEKGLRYMIEKYGLQDLFNQGFKDALITDREIYFVEHRTIDEDPYIRRVNPMSFYHSIDDEVDYIGECGWTMEFQNLTANQIIDEFKGDLTADQVEEIMEGGNNPWTGQGNTSNSISTDYEQMSSGDDCGPGAPVMGAENNIPVYRCRWSSIRELKFKKSKSKNHDGVVFTKLISDDDKLKKEDEVEIRYVNDIWEGVLIGSNIFTRCRKCPVQLRGIDKIGKVENGYTGFAYNYRDKRPYSLIWAARDIQSLYNIIYYHKELWIALSGVKGFFMDYSQMPQGMSPTEWQYYRKMGTAWIQTVRDGEAASSFNQFKAYDDTISDSIKNLTEMLSYLDDMAGQITGVTRQRMGQTERGDLVRNTEMSIQNSSMVTEFLFYRHELLKKRALNRLINMTRLAWREGKRGQYVMNDLGQSILNIMPGEIEQAEYEVFMSNSGRENEKIQEVRQLAAQSFANQALSLGQIIKLYDMDNLREMQAAVDHISKLQEKAQSENMQAMGQAETEKEMAIIEKEQGFQAMIEQNKIQVEMMKIEIEKMKLGVTGETKMADVGAKRHDTDTEKEVELLYLEEEKRQSNMSNAIEIAKMSGMGEKPASKEGSPNEGKKINKEKVKDK